MRNNLNKNINFENNAYDNDQREAPSNKTKKSNDKDKEDAFDDEPLNYVPTTFEGMMESFGVNLQRKNLYTDYYEAV